MARTSPVHATLRTAVAATIAALQTAPEDAGALRLASEYAGAIDDDGDLLDALGPKLLACLVQLGATPAARAATTPKGGAGHGAASPLDALRAARAAR